MTNQEMAPNRYVDYNGFGWFYNKYWSDFSIRALSMLEELLLKHLPLGTSILDLCCGTGQLVNELSERGYKVIGLDASEDMISFARKNASGCEFIIEDARYFKLQPDFDAVVSVYDSLNHIMDIDELIMVFRNVHACLHEKGMFVFDMNMEEGYISRWRGSFGFVEEDHVCVVRSTYSTISRIGEFDITLFRLQDDWQRSDIRLSQKCYSNEEIRSALETAGFTDIQVFARNEQGNPVEFAPKDGRAFFVSIKPES